MTDVEGSVREKLRERERRGVTVAERRTIDRDLIRLADAPTFDRTLHSLVSRALGESALPTWGPKPLSVGETYLPLLLREAPPEGHALRVHAVEGRSFLELPPAILSAGWAPAWQAVQGLIHELDRAECGIPGKCSRLEVGTTSVRIQGASFGLALCVALLSRWTGRAAKGSVAGTACVTQSGELEPVKGLPAKLRALSERWEITTVVVAACQDVPADPGSLRIIPCRTLADALEHFGLELKGLRDLLPLSDLDLRGELLRLDRIQEQNHTNEAWADVSQRAVRLALIAEEHSDRYTSARALSYGALSALHAGEESEASRLIRLVPDDIVCELEGSAPIWHHIVVAATRIDEGALDRAVMAAEAAVALCERAPRQTQDAFSGKAHGTLGRAYLEAGQPAQALPSLRKNVELQMRQQERARSRCYLAQGLRLSGDPAGALEQVKLALTELRGALGSSTATYLHLEQARCHQAENTFGEAIRCFDAVVDAQLHDVDYPRLAAVRGLAACHRRLGRRAEADAAFERCRIVWEALDPEKQRTKLKVALMAAGDLLLFEDSWAPAAAPAAEQRSAAWQAWRLLSPGDQDLTQVRAAVGKQVY